MGVKASSTLHVNSRTHKVQVYLVGQYSLDQNYTNIYDDPVDVHFRSTPTDKHYDTGEAPIVDVYKTICL